MKIVVTGGAGFIGSNTCEDLIKNGHDVICLDNFLTGKRENISHLIKLESFALIEGDIRDIGACNNAVKTRTLYFILQLLVLYLDQLQTPLLQMISI